MSEKGADTRRHIDGVRNENGAVHVFEMHMSGGRKRSKEIHEIGQLARERGNEGEGKLEREREQARDTTIESWSESKGRADRHHDVHRGLLANTPCDGHRQGIQTDRQPETNNERCQWSGKGNDNDKCVPGK